MYFSPEEIKEIRLKYKDSFKCIKSNTIITKTQCGLRNGHFKCRSEGCGYVEGDNLDIDSDIDSTVGNTITVKKLKLKRRKK